MLGKIFDNLTTFGDHNAFFINGIYYTYADLHEQVGGIQKKILSAGVKQDVIGLLTDNSIVTYSAILAILFSGYGFVPLNPGTPVSRNRNILGPAGIRLILHPGLKDAGSLIDAGDDIRLIDITDSDDQDKNPPVLVPRSSESTAYILFTSGSTGVPKGVIISITNLTAFLDAFFACFPGINEHDRFLQMFGLSFDASVLHYIPALSRGACVFTLNETDIKSLVAYKLLKDHDITFAFMMPSTLSYLKSYLANIHLPSLKYSLLGGEPVPHELLFNWSGCVPNAQIFNVYGPTEVTVIFLSYNWTKYQPDFKPPDNGLAPIGKPLQGSCVLLVDEDRNPVTAGIGEICVSGPQVSPGYLNDPVKNNESFFLRRLDDVDRRFYSTGDLAYLDENGDYMFCGRVDEQVKIDGYRVELNEIGMAGLAFSATSATSAIVYQNKIGTQQIALFIENTTMDCDRIRKKLKEVLPGYMIPAKIVNIVQLPKNTNGKVNKKALSDHLQDLMN